jgi:hypothetical protein
MHPGLDTRPIRQGQLVQEGRGEDEDDRREMGPLWLMSAVGGMIGRCRWGCDWLENRYIGIAAFLANGRRSQLVGI